MGENDDGCSTQLIDGNGEFNVKGLDNFVKKTKLSDCGLSYAVVAIMGPQSSGMILPLCFSSYLILIKVTVFGVVFVDFGIWVSESLNVTRFYNF